MYTMDYRIYLLVGTNPAALPIEAIYDSSSASFTYSKCNPLSPPGDSECDISVTPYDKEFNIVVEAFLVEPQSFDTPVYVFNDNTQFKVTIEDPCPYDSVSISPASAIQSFTYFISVGQEPATFAPVVNHRYPACPIDCDLYSVIVETGEFVDYAQAIVENWSLPPYL